MKNTITCLAAAMLAAATGAPSFGQAMVAQEQGIRSITPPIPTAPATAPATITADKVPGKTVTLSITNKPLRQALLEFQNQTGLQVQIYDPASNTFPHNEKLVSLDAKDKPMWEVLLGLLKQIDNSESTVSFSIGKTIGTMDQAVGKPLVVGPFMLVAGGLVPDVPARPVNDQANRLALQMRVLRDPSLNIWSVSYRSNPTRATDDKGNNLVPSPAVTHQFTAFGKGFDYLSFPKVSVLLQDPPPGVARGSRIALIEGVLLANISDVGTIEIPQGQKVEKRYGNVKLTAQWGLADDIVAANLAVGRMGPGGTGEPYALVRRWEPDESVSQEEWVKWQTQNLAGPSDSQLYDAAGKAFVPMRGAGGSSSPQSRSSVSIVWFGRGPGGANAPGEPTKAVVKFSINGKTIEVPYRFENITLP